MAFSDPRKNVAQFGLREGMCVADFGAGSGHYATAAAERVGERGRVYAIDVQRDLLKRMKNFSRGRDTESVEVIWGDVEQPGGSKLQSASVDGVILSNVLFQVEHRRSVIDEAKRVLKPGGHVFFIEWSDSFGNLGPRAEDVIERDAARELFRECGFSEERQLNDVGDHHYGFVFKKPS